MDAAPVPRSVPLSVNGKAATEGCLWIGDKPIEQTDIAESPMLRRLSGIAGLLDARSLADLRRSLNAPLAIEGARTPIATLRLTRGGDSVDRSVVRLESGILMLVSEEDSGVGRVLDPAELSGVGVDRSLLDGVKLLDPHEPLREELTKYASQYELETPLRRIRFKNNYPPLTRVLEDERYRVRLPRGDGRRRPPGVLVWISPIPSGQIPDLFYETCDALNLIAVGVDNNGNERELTDRLQNHLDSIATIAAHFTIDERRTYVTGMSGGGRCSSILQLAFPDVFTGAVPIVGLDSYHKTPTGQGNQFWPDHQGRPDARWFRMLADRRIAAITGTMDFNAPEMRKRTQQMKDDGIQIRLDVIEGMGHTMPSPEQFSEALRWVDELQQARIDDADSKAQSMLDNLLKRSGEDCGQDPGARKILIRITIDAPWSDPAWKAVEILGIKG